MWTCASVVKNTPASAGNMSSIPDPGRSNMALAQLSPCATAIEPCSRAREPHLRRARVPQLLKPAHLGPVAL